MRIDLDNSLIMVTRPKPAGERLCEKIVAAGGRAFYFPTVEYAPPSDSQQIVNTVQTLAAFDWMIFISAAAVQAIAPILQRYWPRFPHSVKIAAIGEKTAETIKLHGLPIHAYPADWGSEGLLALAKFNAVSEKKILIVRGSAGRELLAETLTKRGAEITYLEAYRRQLPNTDHSHAINLLQDKQINAIICTSFESVVNLTKLIPDAYLPQLKRVPLIVVSDRIKNLAQNLDFQTIWVAKNAADVAILELLGERKQHAR